MTPTADLSILSLMTKATLVVQLVMLLLAVLSIGSWTAIFQKWFSIRRAKRETNDFEKQFWGGADLTRLFEIASNPRRKGGSEERIFEAGMSGRLDATNVLDAPITVITTIGLDHEAFLGNTIEKIAREKAGIIKRGTGARALRTIIEEVMLNIMYDIPSTARGVSSVVINEETVRERTEPLIIPTEELRKAS